MAELLVDFYFWIVMGAMLPWNLGTFSPLKSRYRKEIADLAYLDDAASVKKCQFVEAYQKAQAETFTTRTLRAGWSAAGLFPWNPTKTLNSSQLHKSCASDFETLLRTPKHPQDIYYAVQRLGPLTRDQQTVFQKAQKALREAAVRASILYATNERLRIQIDQLESKKKKRKVILDPNTIFANVESIKRSLEEAEKARGEAEAEKAKIAEKKAQAKAKEPSLEEAALRTSRNLQKAQMESCMFQWEL
ncbi:hypothetical protein HOY80DRAFT_1055092 [Tuber brumale]|nr:hypothetical protein HOY80DRAFT_1055092 [Tuber brumale]